MPARPVPTKAQLTYADLDTHYPNDGTSNTRIGGACDTYVNQCAIRMSRALAGAGFPLGGNYTKKYGPVCTADNITHARGAKALADSLFKVLGHPESLTSDSSAAIDGRKGIVFFHPQKDVVSTHIDLWDGTGTKGYNPFGSGSAKVWFWPLP